MGTPHLTSLPQPGGPMDELEELLAFYAARRLAPRYGAIPRIRAAVFAEAERRSPAFVNRAAVRRARLARRGIALGLAASLTVAGGATVLAAGPDSPLYGARLWVEQVTLPAAADDRADAHHERLEIRLGEARAAAQAGNSSAVAQALAAYRAEVAAALADVGEDGDRLARLEAALGTHLVVLDALVGTVPAQAAEAIEAAMDASDNAVDKIKEKKAKPNGPPSPRPGRP